MSSELYTCPCCGYKTLEDGSPGSFEICSLCYWENDNVQADDPHYEGGANEVSLYQAQRNFIDFGASDKKYIGSVQNPTLSVIKDPKFKIID